jgi:hypothetical protein
VLTGEYVEWLVGYRQWGWCRNRRCSQRLPRGYTGLGFNVADARRFTIWQGDQDPMVPADRAIWLAEHVPGADLRMLAGEGHLSIGLHFSEIVSDLLARAGQTSASSGQVGLT